MLGVSYRLSCKGELKSACGQVEYQHYNKQSAEHAEKVKISHKDYIAKTSCKAGAAFLRHGSEYKSCDQGCRHRSMHASRAGLTGHKQSRCKRQHKQKYQKCRDHKSAGFLGRISSAQRKSSLKGKSTGKNSQHKAWKCYHGILISG